MDNAIEGNGRVADGAAGAANQRSSFICSVCIEALDVPADVLGMPQEAALPPEQNPGRGRGRGRGRGQGRGQGPLHAQPDPAEIVTTGCGHMYHNLCLTTWFSGMP